MKLKKETLVRCVLIIAIIISITICSIVLIKINQEDDVVDQEEVIPETIEVIPYTDYDWSNLVNIDSHLSYEDDSYYSMFGIDVAAHQGTINWSKVKESGVEFAYIRLGYRGATEGILHTDEQFENNYKGATENGIKVGIYWYSQPSNVQEALNEADYVIKVLDGRHLDLPIAYDFEETIFFDGSLSRMHGMKSSSRTKMAQTFLSEITKNHYDVMIYTNLDWAQNYYNFDKLQDYPIWFAQYADYPDFDRPFIMWQYQDDGKINGINTYVDLDIMFIQKNDQN